MTLLDAALAHARDGRPVFPCAGKRPATVHGLKDATTDVDRIRRWWTAHPGHWIGSPTAGHLVVDLDVADGADTWVAWLELALAHGWDIDDTRMTATPSGGLHIWYRTDDPRVRNTASRLAPHIDTRAAGGYCIVPPSPGYEWLNPFTAIATAPAWLLDLCTPVNPATRSASGRSASTAVPTARSVASLRAMAERLAQQSEGSRNGYLFWAAAAAGDTGATVDQVAIVLTDAARRAGLADREIASTLNSAFARWQ